MILFKKDIFLQFYRAVFLRLGKTNPVTLGLSSVSVTGLLFYEFFLSERISEFLCGFYFPIQLLAVIVGTTVSYLMDLHHNHNVQIIGHVPTG